MSLEEDGNSSEERAGKVVTLPKPNDTQSISASQVACTFRRFEQEQVEKKSDG